jgi:hypothetical protein
MILVKADLVRAFGDGDGKSFYEAVTGLRSILVHGHDPEYVLAAQ